jgi:hypothetical protein
MVLQKLKKRYTTGNRENRLIRLPRQIPYKLVSLIVWRFIMGFATHLGPWLLGTVKNTTGTTAGLIRNTGDTIVAQTIVVGYADINTSLTATLGAIPAGA